ncbi:sugar ABC transporter ATP-binding protein [Pseudotabrizicola sp. 4114]|uniref:sugar ABC transporter ATP-binding protein n=1 Tax=Pseudotabrizicola sp. 4114 TaxID=2817731 RepID=UPI002856DFA5|nr:ribose transport system ATP-binding protein [Pseudorhodobacter sp. 4114]
MNMESKPLNLIELDRVSKSYNRNLALDDLTIHVKRNEVLGLIGENGAGKSTLLKILGGVHSPDKGMLRVNGKERSFREPNDAAAAGIGIVHQEQSLIENLSVAENISLGSRALAGSKPVVRFGFYRWGTINDEGQKALTHIGSEVSPTEIVSRLSFADKQMVEIAKAVRQATQSGNEPVIILDEPTSVLEKQDIDRLETEVQRLKAIGSVIFVSHRLDEIRRFCDRVYVMRAGRIVAECQASELVDENLFYLMTGRAKLERKPQRRGDANPAIPALQLRGAGCMDHFSDVDLTVEKGEVHVLVGARHSGREELCRALFGLLPFTSGSALVSGTELRGATIRKAISMGIAYLPAERKLEGMVAGLTVAENLLLAHPAEARFGGLLNFRRMKDEAMRWINKLDVRPTAPDLDIGQLSGGNQQKVVLAKWARSPNLRLLLLDTPTRGVDPGAREYINSLIEELCATGVGVLLLADTLDEALAVGHRITVMKDGRISACFQNSAESSPELSEIVKHMI